MEDPIAAARHRFPVNPAVVPVSDELPSTMRPFVLRHASPAAVPAAVIDAKHRTPKTRLPRSRETNLDSRVVQDTYYVPDD